MELLINLCEYLCISINCAHARFHTKENGEVFKVVHVNISNKLQSDRIMAFSDRSLSIIRSSATI